MAAIAKDKFHHARNRRACLPRLRATPEGAAPGVAGHRPKDVADLQGIGIRAFGTSVGKRASLDDPVGPRNARSCKRLLQNGA